MSGIVCKCGSAKWHTLETRWAEGAVKRRKECIECGERVTTYEKPAEVAA